jgi:hypothetical protein
MVWIFATAALASPALPPTAAARPARQAQAIVRILRPAQIRFGAAKPPEAIVRSSQVRERDGSASRASLTEFF